MTDTTEPWTMNERDARDAARRRAEFLEAAEASEGSFLVGDGPA